MTSNLQHRRGQGGFTLVEVLSVLAIMGLVGTIVMTNLGAFLPKTLLDSEANRLIANVGFLRSESRIQGQRIELQLDLDNARWRRVLAPEQRVSTLQTDDELAGYSEDWTALEPGVTFQGAGNPQIGIQATGLFTIVFDEKGRSADQAVFLTLTADDTMVWSVRLRGLTGACDVVRDFDGAQQPLTAVTEGVF